MNEIDYSKVVPISEMSGDDEEDTDLLRSMLTEAERYIISQKWCNKILEQFFGLGVGGVVAVFLFHIKPSGKNIDEYIWVIVGDLPPLYITVDVAPNPACALDAYIGTMEDWANAAIEGKDVNRLVPINACPTKKNGKALKKRLDFLDKKILSLYQEDL